ncbi:prolyl-tRNA synthetase associated domain-containing protein [Desnuesiella massiliensis]|uniref:prolyl-tRNA synthetase associated domain-containing protein n=1 Tax=Desnuesiella massiliensis TaxID=1650662 RepID=UPI0006E3B583|nr:prolyl-tRNA synthetase associated domain-containing protein [Desnuesiella massiliensis]
MKVEEKRVYDILEKLDIGFEKYEHNAIFTIEEANELAIDMKGAHCKNLFIRNRKGNQHYLVILEESKTADLKALSSQIGSTPLSFASEERLYKYLNLTPGSVTPFGLINDSEKHVRVLIDNDLIHSEYISFHPNINTATITITYDDFEKFLNWCGNNVTYVNL